MKAIEFQSHRNSDHSLSVPDDVAAQLNPSQQLRVLLLVVENDEDRQWEQLAATEMGAGYADSDAIYDLLSGR
jgi:hypothetical protein